jgi:hypothetical protein
MPHVPDAVLRRLVDEPLAVPDAARHHLDTCRRCQSSGSEIAADAALAAAALSRPQVTGDTGQAWARFQQHLASTDHAKRTALRVPRRPAGRLVGTSVGTGAAVTAGLLAAGVAAAATLTTVFAPTWVASVPVDRGDLKAIASMLGVGTAQLHGGPLPAAGAQRLPFGTVRWTSAGQARRVASIAQASAMTQLAYSRPATLPAGVGSPTAIVAQPMVTATVTFSRSASAAVGGSSLIVTGGPAMLVQYGSSSGGANLTTLGVLAMRRPVATSSGATTSQLEAFLLSRPGVPAGLAQEIRLLGDPSRILPVPVPSGVAAAQVRIAGAPGILVADPSGAVSGVIWEGRDGIIHAVAGLLDRKDILNVARQIG